MSRLFLVEPSNELSSVQALLEQRFGIACADWQCTLLSRAMERMRRRGPARFEPSSDELYTLANEVAVRETYFFRDQAQIDAFVDMALPARLSARTPDMPIRILSAGCASGEEAYSLGLAIGERVPAAHVRIHGIDICADAIERAHKGWYSPWSLRAAPGSLRERCFINKGEGLLLKTEHRARVTFERRNLLDDDPDFWKPEAFDIIFCRNVTMYFSARAIRATATRFAASLAPGGFLFLGTGETLRGISDDFEPICTDRAIFYQRKATTVPPPRRTEPNPSRESWTEAIGQATSRVMELTTNHAAAPAATKPVSSQPLWQLVKVERFEEALALLRNLPKETASQPEMLQLEAVALSGLGRIPELERACQRLVAACGEHAGSHYLLGLCGEQAGDRARAAFHYREAIRIDPSFAMAHLRMGLLARWAGDLEGARVQLEWALARLAENNEEHILLFGGGFSRQMLEDLCRAELGAAGAEP